MATFNETDSVNGNPTYGQGAVIGDVQYGIDATLAKYII
jgi:hypothetical protein